MHMRFSCRLYFSRIVHSIFTSNSCLLGQAEFIVQSGIGGAMFWTLDFDDFGNSTCSQGDFPLISEVYQALNAANPFQTGVTLAGERACLFVRVKTLT